MAPSAGRRVTGEPRVRFADGFDRPERIAFGLEAPQLAVVVAGSLLAWSILHGSAPAVLRCPVAGVIALLSAALGWGRWQERPLLTWAWLAARFAALPRTGGRAAVLTMEQDGGETPAARAASHDGSRAGKAGGAEPPPPHRHRPRRQSEASEHGNGSTPGEPAASTPAWLKWLSPRSLVQEETAPGREPGIAGGGLGDLDFEEATHAVITGVRRRAEPLRPAGRTAPPRESVVLLPTPAQSADRSINRGSSSRARVDGDEAARLAPVLRLRTAGRSTSARLAPLELDDRADPNAPNLLPARPRGHIATRTRRVAFFALSGGSGRTALAVEAACLVAAEGHHVALLDLDLHAPAVAMRLGLPQPERWDPQILGGDRISCLDDLLVTHRTGVRILLGPARAASGDTLAPARVAELLHLLEREGAELVLVDLPGDLSALSTLALAAMDEVFIVLTPTARGAQDAYRTTEALRRIGLGTRLRYVVNRAGIEGRRVRGESRPLWTEGADTIDAALSPALPPDVDLTEVMGDLGGEIVATVPFDAGLEAGEDTHTLTGVGGLGPASVALRRLGLQLVRPAAVTGRDPDPPWG